MSKPKERYVVWGVLEDPTTKRILVVANRRRGDKVNWSLPGGLVGREESYPEALTREFKEETGLLVDEDDWSRLYTTRVKQRNRGRGKRDVNSNFEVYFGTKWLGDLDFSSDPDRIVEHGLFAKKYLVHNLLRRNYEEVYEPLSEWLESPWWGETKHFRYRVEGHGSKRKVTRVSKWHE